MVGEIYCGHSVVTLEYLLSSYLVCEGVREVKDSAFCAVSPFR